MTVHSPPQASFFTIQEALALHLEPDISWSHLPRLLDIITHIALLASKLTSEIERIRDDAAGEHGLKLEMEHQASLIGVCTMCKSAEQVLWQQSLILREMAVKVALSVGTTDLNKLLKLIKTYFPTIYEVENKPDMDKKPFISSTLYIRAMPSDMRVALLESGDRVKETYDRAVETRNANPLVRDLQAEQDSADTVRQASDQVFEYIAMSEKILSNYRSQSNQAPRRSIVQIKPEQSSPQVSRTDRYGSYRQSRQSQPDNGRSQHSVQEETLSDRITPKIESNTPIRSGNPSKTKKRSRPSFPPREGPDYTRPLPTSSSTAKKQRLQPFHAKDLKR